MTDAALALCLAPDLPEAERLHLVRLLPPGEWEVYERLCWTADELNAGRVPEGVIVCR